LGKRFLHSTSLLKNISFESASHLSINSETRLENTGRTEFWRSTGGLFGRIWKKLGTKAKLWAMMRSLFSILVFDSMKALYRHLAGLYQLQL